MTKDEALKEALDALKHVEDVYCVTYEEAMIAIESALAEPDTDMAYTIALQRAIEWHCDGKAVPPDVAEVCPYHAEMLNKTLAQQETDWEAVAADQAMTIAMMKIEQEPVAWRTFDGEGGYEYRTYDMNEVNATPHAELIADLMNPNNPKNDREHAAVREIERLREALAQPEQPEERNFCPRCGKRTPDLTTIHTCTPPQENT